MESTELMKCNYCGTEYPIKDKNGRYITVFDEETKTTRSRCPCCYSTNDLSDYIYKYLGIEEERQLDIELPIHKEFLKTLKENTDDEPEVYDFPLEFGANITLDNLSTGRLSIPEESDDDNKYTKQKNKHETIKSVLFIGGELLTILSIFINPRLAMVVLPSFVCIFIVYLIVKRRRLGRKLLKMYNSNSMLSGYIDLEEGEKVLFDPTDLHDQCPYCISKQYKKLHKIGSKNTLVKCKECGTKYRINKNREDEWESLFK